MHVTESAQIISLFLDIERKILNKYCICYVVTLCLNVVENRADERGTVSTINIQSI